MLQSLSLGLSNNRVLRLTEIIITFIKVLLLICAFLLIGIFLVALFVPEFLDSLGSDSGFSITSLIKARGFNELMKDLDFKLQDLSLWTRADAFLRVILNLWFDLMIIHKFQSFIRKSRNSESYFKDNALIFKSMSFWFMCLAVIEALPILIIFSQSVETKFISSTSTYFTFPLEYLLWALICLIFSEVFKEGERLKQESEYTI